MDGGVWAEGLRGGRRYGADGEQGCGTDAVRHPVCTGGGIGLGMCDVRAV